jgi:hypothetical protein
MEHDIFIITRREFKENKGLGSFGIETKLNIDEFKGLKDYWITLLSDNYLNDFVGKYIKKDLGEKYQPSPYQLKKTKEGRVILEKYFDKISEIRKYHGQFDTEYLSYWKPNLKYLEGLFVVLNNHNTLYKAEQEYLLNINILNSDFYIYHHWLDRQNLGSDNRKLFILTLRNEIVDYHTAKLGINSNDTIKVNWLIHDSDLGAEGADGMIYYEGNIINENNSRFVEMSDLFDLDSKGVNIECKRDNFWIFNHTKGTNGLYDKIILADQKSTFFSDAKTLKKHLSYDGKKLKFQAKILKEMHISSTLNIAEPLIQEFKDNYNRRVKATGIGSEINDPKSLNKAVNELSDETK